jgi:hypothetical protein
MSKEVNVTSDLGIFTKIKGNRPENPQHIKRLAESIRTFGMLINPILVNKNYEVIDGQHRLAAAKLSHSNIYYIIVEDYGLKQVHALNLNQKNWSAKDFMVAYAKQNERSYVLLLDFYERHAVFTLQDCIMMCSNNAHCMSYSGQKKYNTKNVFNEGTWEAKDMGLAEEWAENIKLVKQYYRGYTRTTFVGTMLGLFKHPNFDFSEFLGKLKMQPTALVDCANREQYRDLIEDIYNWKRRDKVNLRY